MSEENEKLFEQEFVKEESPVEDGSMTMDDDLETPDLEEIDYELGELSDQQKKEVVLKEEDLKKTFIIETAEIRKPILKDIDGKMIPPIFFKKDENGKVLDPDKKGYVSKLILTYKDTDYISIIPNVKWYIGTNQHGKPVLNPWFRTTGLTKEDLNDNFTAQTSKLYFRYCDFLGMKPGKVTQKEFVDGLVGKKVKLINTPYKKHGANRIDVTEFVK